MELTKKLSYTNGVRHQININKSLLSKTNKIFKKHTWGLKRFVGRSSLNGRITVRHHGAGCKKKFRFLEFNNIKTTSLLICTMYDPFRNGFISLHFDLLNKQFFNKLSTLNVGPGSIINCGLLNVDLCLGNSTILKNIPAGSLLHSLSITGKSCFSRSAGSFFQILQKNENTCHIRLPSGEIKIVDNNSYGTIGVVSNIKHNLTYIGKSGKNRLKGIRPTVRGVAMNPVDHPHGGRTNGGRPSVTPWGIPTKGKPTVKKKL
jgi:large subunit ribosomal protein L2